MGLRVYYFCCVFFIFLWLLWTIWYFISDYIFEEKAMAKVKRNGMHNPVNEQPCEWAPCSLKLSLKTLSLLLDQLAKTWEWLWETLISKVDMQAHVCFIQILWRLWGSILMIAHPRQFHWSLDNLAFNSIRLCNGEAHMAVLYGVFWMCRNIEWKLLFNPAANLACISQWSSGDTLMNVGQHRTASCCVQFTGQVCS